MGELGSWLVRAREARGLTLEDAERDTRISRRYLQALEAEQFDAIPAPVYARGFLRSYSQYLGLDPQEMLALFPRDEEPAYTTQGAPARPPAKQPASAVGPARPAWRRPTPPQATRPAARQGRTTAEDVPWEPTIGIDIGVPLPSRRLKTDPAAQTRSLAIAAVAIVGILAVILLALFISRAGGSSNSKAPDLAPKSQLTAAAGTAGTGAGQAATVPPGASGLPVTAGIVPNVTGQPADKARLAIQEAGFKPKERRDKSSQPKDTVVQQSPAPDVALQPGLEVTIVISDGP